MNKPELISAIRKARAEWEASISPLDEDQIQDHLQEAQGFLAP